MDTDDSPQNKIGYEGEPDYSTLEGAQEQESGNHKPVSVRDRISNAAADTLRKAETGVQGAAAAATGGASTIAGKALGTKIAGHANNTKGRPDPKQKTNIKGKSNRRMVIAAASVLGPVVGIFALLFVFSNFGILPHYAENSKDKTNSLAVANDANAKQSYQAMLDANVESGYAKIDEEGCADFTATGDIEYSVCTESQDDPEIQAYYRKKALEDSTLAATTAASPGSAGNVFKYTDRDGIIHIIDKDNFSDWFDNNPGFNEAITSASQAWTGTFSGWFDDAINFLMRDLSLTRNAFQSYYEDINNQAESEADYRKIVQEVNIKSTMSHTDVESLIPRSGCSINANDSARMSELISHISAQFVQSQSLEIKGYCRSTSKSNIQSWEEAIDGMYGEYITENRDGTVNIANNVIWRTSTSTTVSSELIDARNRIEAYLPEFARTLKKNSGSSDTCAQLYGLSYFSSIIAANRLQQAADFASKALESVDKMRAGLGSTSPIHQVGKQLSQSSTYEYLENDTTKTSTTALPAANAQAFSWVTTNSAIDINNANILKLSLESILKGFVIDSATFTACTATKLIGVSLFGVLNIFLGQDAFFGKPENAQLGSREFIDKALTQAAYSLIFNPCVGDDENQIALGEDVGNCFALGTHYYLAKNHQIGGGTPGDQAKIEAFIRKQNGVIAKKAERERANRSPFDITSPYTFLGSIVSQVSPHLSSIASSNFFSSIGSIVSSSINTLLPSASAYTEEDLRKNLGECNYLGGIGALGDAFCVPYIIMDVTPTGTVEGVPLNEASPLAIEKYLRCELKAFEPESDDNKKCTDPDYKPEEEKYPIIKQDSNFAKYIKYCSQRLAIFGVIDASIAADYTQGVISGNLLYWLMGLVGIDVSGIIELRDKETILGWSSGQYCVATDNADPETGNPKWAENQYYQYYMSSDRTNSNRGGIEESNAMPILETFRKNNPINSVQDTLAATAGMPTKDYLALHTYILYQSTDKSTFGPSIATTSAPQKHTFRHSITPLTDFLIEKVIPFTTPDLTTKKQQGTTA